MSLKIRLQRAGAKKKPFYRIVVANSTAPRDGKFIEKVGTYNPNLDKSSTDRVQLNQERITYWLKTGATPTERVALFIATQGFANDNAAVKEILNKREKTIKVKQAEAKKKAEEEAKKKAAEEAKAAAEAKAAEEAEKAAAAEAAKAAEAPAA